MSNRGGLLTLKEAAQQVGISKQGLWLWVGRGLDAKQYGKYWFVTPRALERWKQRTGRSTSPEHGGNCAQIAVLGQEGNKHYTKQ
ncbi:MAG TPA: helix-turn-helix domain-containing protein [Ktedonobacterales bacterium]|nr:helix-turn-helix domain-containing protein [Ktedonobacterales bacterium]